MNINDINELWAVDAIITDDVFEEEKKIPKLHQKYYKIMIEEGLRLRNEKNKLTELSRDKTEYYGGQMDAAELRERGWQPLGLKILRADVPMYVESDKDIIAQSLTVGIADMKVKYLEDILKMIHSRNFVLKGMIDWARFSSGQS